MFHEIVLSLLPCAGPPSVGAGVGRAEASALSAVVTWMIRDGTGMLGRILFAWMRSGALDSYMKPYRLLADFMCDFALFTVPQQPHDEHAMEC